MCGSRLSMAMTWWCLCCWPRYSTFSAFALLAGERNRGRKVRLSGYLAAEGTFMETD